MILMSHFGHADPPVSHGTAGCIPACFHGSAVMLSVSPASSSSSRPTSIQQLLVVLLDPELAGNERLIVPPAEGPLSCHLSCQGGHSPGCRQAPLSAQGLWQYHNKHRHQARPPGGAALVHNFQPRPITPHPSPVKLTINHLWKQLLGLTDQLTIEALPAAAVPSSPGPAC
jgi:hypothetical protein